MYSKDISKRRFLRIVLSLLVIICILFTNVSIARSGLEEEREKLANYKKQLDNIKKNIVSVDKSAKEISSLIDSLNNDLANLQVEIKKTQSNISDLEKQIAQKEAEIKAKEAEIANRQDDVSLAIALSYQLSKISPVEIFYEGNDPEAVSKRITYISYIAHHTDNLMVQAEQDKKDLENYKAQLSSTKASLSKVLQEKQEREQILEEEVDMKNRLLKSLEQKKTYLLYQKSELEDEIEKEEQLIQKLIEEAKQKGIYAGDFIWPISVKIVITSKFGMRLHPILGVWRLHDGIDMAIPTGTPVKASATGTVTYVGSMSGYGNVVILSHGENFSTLYAHLKSFAVKKGQVVKQGQVIAYSDNTGWSTGPHLHFSIYKIDINTGKSTAVDPLKYLP